MPAGAFLQIVESQPVDLEKDFAARLIRSSIKSLTTFRVLVRTHRSDRPVRRMLVDAMFTAIEAEPTPR